MKEQRNAGSRATARPGGAARSGKIAVRPYRPPRIVTCRSEQVERLIRSWSRPARGQALHTP